MKICFVFGTRPEIIKMSPIIRVCVEKNIDFFTIHTGQHYSHSMSMLFMNELSLPEPEYKLDIKSLAPYRQGDHTGRMMVAIEEILLKEMPSVVLVHGDTNSTLAGALVASKISTTQSFTGFDIKLGHVEAGLRSYDRSMPEEINRIMSDHLSDYLFVPTENARETAIGEGIPDSKICVTGNTIVDALQYGIKLGNTKFNVFDKYNIEKNKYMLMTLHRQENVDDEPKLNNIIAAIEIVTKKHRMPIIFPIHPRTVKMFEKFDLQPSSEFIRQIEPCSFLEFLQLEANAALTLTDSGGVQEESCILGVPCVTLRTSTERPETVKVGANKVAGVDSGAIVEACNEMIFSGRNWDTPFGDGNSACKIINCLNKEFSEK